MAAYTKKDYNFRSYNFKSVGESLNKYRQNNRLDDADFVDKPPIGIKTPVQLSVGYSGLLDMHYDLGDQIKDNFRNLLLTNHGERLGFYDFGANLKELTFELGNEQFDSIAMSRITQAVETYMPFISLDNFEPFVDTEQTSQDLGIVGIRVKYSVPSVKLTNQCIEIILAVGG